MRRCRAALLLTVALTALVALGDQHTIRICVPDEPDSGEEVSACTRAVDAVYSTPDVNFKCIGGRTDNECMFRVSQRQDHLTLVAENEMFVAHHLHDLTGYIAEAYESSNSGPEAVAYGLAVVKKDFCSDLPNGWQSLKSKGNEYSACSTGYRRTTGFVLPAGKMFVDGIFEERAIPEDKSINEDAYNWARFFKHVCAPRTTANGPRRDGTVWEPLCDLCASASNATSAEFGRFNGPPEDYKCGESEDPNDTAYNPYTGYTGAFQCLLDGSDTPTGSDKRIAFTKQTVINQYNGDSRWDGEPDVDENNFSILCNSACLNFSEWKNTDGTPNEQCITGGAATHSMVGKKSHSDGTISPEAFQAAIDSLADTNKLKDRVVADTPNTEYPFWSAPTLGLYKYTDDGDFINRLPEEQFSVIRNKGPETNPIRVCIPLGETENLPQFCTNVMNELYGGFFGPNSETFLNFECGIPSAGASYSHCFDSILRGEFDITAAGGNELFQSNKEFGLDALVAESYDDGDSTASYFGIQVVKASQCPNIGGLSDLEGMNLCSTGYRKTSGWFLPVGRLFSEGVLERKQDPQENVNSDAYSVADFFDRVCCPRTTDDGPARGGGQFQQFCDLCAEADGVTDPCSGSQDANPYADYTGAFRCGMEQDNAVAWVKHTTLQDFNDQYPQEAQDVNDYRLVCSDGCREWTESNYKDNACKNGESASKAVVTRPEFISSGRGEALRESLYNHGEVKLAAKEIAGQGAFFWSASTNSIVDVSERDFRGDFFNAFKQFEELREAELVDIASKAKSSEGVLSLRGANITLEDINDLSPAYYRMLNNIRTRLDDRFVERCQSNTQQCASSGVTTLVREIGEQTGTGAASSSLSSKHLLASMDIFVRFVVSGSAPENTHKVIEVMLGSELGPGLGVVDTFNVISFEGDDANFEGISAKGMVVLGGIRSLLPSDVESKDTSAYIQFVQEFQSEMETQIEADTGNKVTATVKDVAMSSSGGKRRSLLQVAVEVDFVVEGASPRQTEQTLSRMQDSNIELAGGTIDQKQIQNVEMQEGDDGGNEDGANCIAPAIILLLLPQLLLLLAAML